MRCSHSVAHSLCMEGHWPSKDLFHLVNICINGCDCEGEDNEQEVAVEGDEGVGISDSEGVGSVTIGRQVIEIRFVLAPGNCELASPGK